MERESVAPLCLCGCGQRVVRSYCGQWNRYILYHRRKGKYVSKDGVNFDIDTYEFTDLDLERLVKKLPERPRRIAILYLMGHTQAAIAKDVRLSRTMITKELGFVRRWLAYELCRHDGVR